MRKRLGVVLLTVLLLISVGSTSVYAIVKEMTDQAPEMIKIYETTYVDEGGYTVTERRYVSLSAQLFGASGSGTFRNEKETRYSNITITYWVEGYFRWDEDRDIVTVSNVRNGHSALGPYITISNEQVVSEDNVGFNFLWGKKYAYAEYSFTLTNPIGLTRDLSVKIVVHNNGQ